MSEISILNVYRSVYIIRHRLASVMYIDHLQRQKREILQDGYKHMFVHISLTLIFK